MATNFSLRYAVTGTEVVLPRPDTYNRPVAVVQGSNNTSWLQTGTWSGGYPYSPNLLDVEMGWTTQSTTFKDSIVAAFRCGETIIFRDEAGMEYGCHWNGVPAISHVQFTRYSLWAITIRLMQLHPAHPVMTLNGQALPAPGYYADLPRKIGARHDLLSGARAFDYRATKREFTLRWERLSQTQLATIESIYNASAPNGMTFVTPRNASHTVQFVEPFTIDFVPFIYPPICGLEIKLEEI